MPNPTQADVARPGCSARGRHGDFRGAVVKESSSERGGGVGGYFRGAGGYKRAQP